MLKFKGVSSKVPFIALGAGYFSIFSNLDINIFLKGYLTIVPVQMLALVYGVYLIYNKKQKDSQKSRTHS